MTWTHFTEHWCCVAGRWLQETSAGMAVRSMYVRVPCTALARVCWGVPDDVARP